MPCASSAPVAAASDIGGLRTFVFSRIGTTPATRALVITTDIFGADALNVHAIAQGIVDRSNGAIDVYVPDICDGDAFPAGRSFDELGAWFAKHGDAEVVPKLAAFLPAVRARGPYLKLATYGYCWGARYALLPAQGASPLVDGFAVAHPTKTTAADYEIANVPALFILAEIDGAFPKAVADEVTAAYAARSATNPAMKLVVKGPYAGTQHGFAARGDDRDPIVGAAKADANESAADFVLGL